jgi:hypothetical protein
MFTIQSMIIYLCILKLYHAHPCAHARLCMLFLIPKTPSRGYKYILVLYDYDGNSIQAEPMKNRSDAEAIRAYSRIYDELTAKGLKPKFQTMDNEASTALKHFLHSKDIRFQLVPPHVHHQNAAERAIQTFKNHFVAMLCSTDTQFPIHLWDRLIPHAVTTLNLLRQLRINPKLSAHAQLHGIFDYNKTTLAPPGTKVILHKKPDHHGSWAPHGLNGWYVGPAMEHYRAHRVFCSTTGHERIRDTVEFFPKNCKVPWLSSADAATIAALYLTNALANPTPTTPFKQPGTNRMQEIKKLAAIFESMAPTRTPVNKHTEPTPKMTTPPTPRVPTSTVPTPRVHPRVTPNDNLGHTRVLTRRSPRGHQPPHVTQEERAYQLLATRGMYLHSEHSPKSIPAAHKKTSQGCVDSALSPSAPAGQQANSAITDTPSTATNWLCLVRTLFHAPHITIISPHKFS